MKRSIVLVLAVVLALTSGVDAQKKGHKWGGGLPHHTKPGSSIVCNQVSDGTPTDTKTKILLLSAGQTVCIGLPGNSYTWTSAVVLNPDGGDSWASNITIAGYGTCSGTGTASPSCTDSTTITDQIDRSTNQGPAFNLVRIPTNYTIRITGIKITMANPCSPSCAPFGVIGGGSDWTGKVVLDNLHFVNVADMGTTFNRVTGVVAKSWFQQVNGTANQPIRAFGASQGDQEWADDTNFGTQAGWFYVEDSTFENGIINDCYTGGRQVFRYNYSTNSGIQQHGTGHSADDRACRAMEIYGNTFNGDAGGNHFAFTAIYGGPMRIWGNVTSAFDSFLVAEVSRQSGTPYGNQPDPPSGWGDCGTAAFGTGSNWDGAQATSTGYPCLDQPGRGKGDLLTGVLGGTKTNTGTGCVNGATSACWPRQALEPIYEWSDTGSIGGGSWINVVSGELTANVDYYFEHGNTSCNQGAGSCTAGVGTGTRAQRPSNCTTGVGWWSSDQGGNWNTSNADANDGTLDICTATNTWTNGTYTPLTYPHPLRS